MSTTTARPHDPAAAEEQTRRTRLRGILNLVLVVVVLVVGGRLLLHGTSAVAEHSSPDVPRSVAMEELTGVRFSRVAVVGDGGLLTVFYVVVDPEKATQFQSDRDHPPHLASESRDGGTSRSSIMRAGHQMRPGQTYYLVYEDTKGAIRPGEKTSITYGGITLHHVPVL